MATETISTKAKNITYWLDNQNETLSWNLRSVADAEKLYDYWTLNPSGDLPEFCDDDRDCEDVDLAAHRINALGYDPLTT